MNLLNKLSIILTLLLFLTITTEAQTPPEYLYHNCPNTTTFTRNSTYQANLNVLLSSLSSNANRSIGFYNASAGRDPDEIIYGLFLCRGDVTTDSCQNCATIATQNVVRNCPVEKAAIIWYDMCLVRYSNSSFFSTMDTNPMIYMWNPNNITDQGRFNSLLGDTMTDAADEAANAPSGTKKFSVKEVNFTAFQKVYSLAQCTPDISRPDCNQCLQNAISNLPNCCNGKQGGRVLSPSCNIRYEIYPFYNSSALGTPPPSPSPPPSPIVLSPPPTARSQGKSGISTVTIVAIVVPITVSVVLFCMVYCLLKRRAKKKYDAVREDDAGNEITTVESLQFDLNTIEAATNKFSDDNKLGEGGFGDVYKGTLYNGQEIAVKRLSRSSVQGTVELTNEVLLLAKLQHRNLVRLLGFCLEGEEKMLVYEFVPNKSLDYFLFDPEKQVQLDWSRRYKIIGGIARGILYLHEDSQLRIIHRDLKASNILLDADMNPKISDFGMAKIFGVDQTQGNTNRIVGTYGYMPPEYAMHGQFSVKSDMYSFGVLVLEIMSGKKNSSFYQIDGTDDLANYVWKHWRDGTPMEVLDPTLTNSYSRNEVLRCIQIGLLCVQEDPADRPTMATIVLLLSSYSVTLPVPQKPAFCLHSRSGQSMQFKWSESGQSTKSTANIVPGSIDDASITEVYPR